MRNERHKASALPLFYSACVVPAVAVFLGSTIGLAQAADSPDSNTVTGTVIVVDKNGNALPDRSNVVVFIDGPSLARTSPQPTTPREISQKGHRFTPRVLAITRGTTVRFPNDDTVFHNVFSLSRAKRFDLGIYPVGNSKEVVFDDPGLVRVYCNIHPQMVSSILILNNPLHTVTASDGRFEISGIPDGEHVLRAWSEAGEGTQQILAFSDRLRLERNMTITAVRGRAQHKNKFGMPYKKSY